MCKNVQNSKIKNKWKIVFNHYIVKLPFFFFFLQNWARTCWFFPSCMHNARNEPSPLWSFFFYIHAAATTHILHFPCVKYDVCNALYTPLTNRACIHPPRQSFCSARKAHTHYWWWIFPAANDIFIPLARGGLTLVIRTLFHYCHTHTHTTHLSNFSQELFLLTWRFN